MSATRQAAPQSKACNAALHMRFGSGLRLTSDREKGQQTVDNDKPTAIPCDGCRHLICALERSVVCGGREAAATIMKREDAAACGRREGKEART